MRPKILIAATVSKTLAGFLLPFAHHFRSRGWRVDGAASGASACEQCGDAFDRTWDVNWSRNPLAPQNLRAVRELEALIDRGRYDLIHVHTPVCGFISRMTARTRRQRTRVVY